MLNTRSIMYLSNKNVEKYTKPLHRMHGEKNNQKHFGVKKNNMTKF